MGNVLRNVQRNPGTIVDLHKECKDLMPDTFEGVILTCKNNRSIHFQLMNTTRLYSSTLFVYRGEATYVGTKHFLPTFSWDDINIWGNMNMSIIHQFTSQLRCKFSSQLKRTGIIAEQLTTDYRGDSFTAALTIGMPDIINNSRTIGSHYLQSVTNKLSLGGELLYQFEPNLPSGRIRLSSFVAKYVHNTWTASGSLGLGGMHLCYSKKFSDQLQVGVEIDASFHNIRQSTANIRAKLDIPGSDVVLRGMLDNNLNASGVLEIRLQPHLCSLAVSGRYDYTENLFMCGIGLIFG